MKLLIASVCLFFQSTSFAQRGETFQSLYDITIKGVTNLEEIGLQTTTTIEIETTVIKDDRYCLWISAVKSITNDQIDIEKQSESADSMLFDLTNNRAYYLTEKISYPYKSKKFLILESGNDSLKIVKGDTLIVLQQKLHKNITPTPTLGEYPHGISKYQTKKFQIILVKAERSKVSLQSVYDRSKNFKKSDTEFKFPF